MTVTTVQETIRSAEPVQIQQYSRRQILGVWAAVTIPMSLLSWIVAPWLSHRLDSRDPFIDALLICFNVGLLWMITLVLILVRREQGSLAWPRVRDALWLRAPQDPKTGRRGGKVWWWALLFTVLSAGVNALPIDPTGPPPRDLPNAIGTDRLAHYFSGNWIGYGLVVAVCFLAPVAEELVFRGLLLPRIRAVFGRGDVVASGVLFTIYHLHQPWSMPATLIDGILNQAYPTQALPQHLDGPHHAHGSELPHRRRADLPGDLAVLGQRRATSSISTGRPGDSGTQQVRSVRHCASGGSASSEARTTSSWAENRWSSAILSAISSCFSSTSRRTCSCAAPQLVPAQTGIDAVICSQLSPIRRAWVMNRRRPAASSA